MINALAAGTHTRGASSITWALPPLTDEQAEAAADAALARLDELGQSCVLDVADQGGQTPDEVARLLSVTREAIRQTEAKVIAQIQRHPKSLRVLGQD